MDSDAPVEQTTAAPGERRAISKARSAMVTFLTVPDAIAWLQEIEPDAKRAMVTVEVEARRG